MSAYNCYMAYIPPYYGRDNHSFQRPYSGPQQDARNKMSFLGIGQQGITLKELLENPKLQTAPSLHDGSYKDKNGNAAYDPTSAFLGPNLWNNTNMQDENFQLEYMDLDEFLSENGIPIDLNDNSVGSDSNKSQKSPAPPLITSSPSSPIITANPMLSGTETQPVHPIKTLFSKDIESPKEGPSSPTIRSLLSVDIDSVTTTDDAPLTPSSSGSVSPPHVDVDFEVDDEDIVLSSVPGHDFDPKRRRFTVEELKPQPIIKKSRKIFVPNDCKDDKYWNRRKKNNVAAKRSRDARRIKENQIAMRASFLEKENDILKQELEKMKKENTKLKISLCKYEGTQ
ncbi:thyrotroph embryonic factor-like [Pecten maximus]|uniref:thyrotroph embryonic factor-like n=1 Tax=Pecten maximus TaxID=6579 RepID=UPI001458C6C9|nr:thyrotroph embryonic factor-like [Pecten maximus]